MSQVRQALKSVLRPDHPAAVLLERACHVFASALANVDPAEGAAWARERREELRTALADAMQARKSLRVIRPYSNEGPVGGRIQLSAAGDAIDALCAFLSGELSRLQMSGGRPADLVPRGLMRSIITILNNNGVPPKSHRSIATACFDGLGIGDKADTHFKAIRAERVSLAKTGALGLKV